jgi:hypothetical protein
MQSLTENLPSTSNPLVDGLFLPLSSIGPLGSIPLCLACSYYICLSSFGVSLFDWEHLALGDVHEGWTGLTSAGLSPPKIYQTRQPTEEYVVIILPWPFQ